MSGVSVRVVDVDRDLVLLTEGPDVVRRTASVAKVLVLSALAAALDDGRVADDEVLRRDTTPRVADSGLWHRMAVDALPVRDVALLVAAVSDNWANNVLVERLGLDAVNGLAADRRLEHTRLHDVVRDERAPEDPPTLSSGTAREWTTVMADLHRGAWVSPSVSRQVLDWLAAGTDHSLVAAAFERDPLVVDALVVTKTGTDERVRCDVGLVRGPARTLAYAALGNGAPGELVPRLRRIGQQVRDLAWGADVVTA
ncbi:serine hydrolase [Nocardioides sp. C4-1]|uniref:serine hydrolase n=1 Tax=Nocardioides sp. C4-1 TaxID=3151851 RepID=UPI0032630B7A